jgi:hypothetical protein
MGMVKSFNEKIDKMITLKSADLSRLAEAYIPPHIEKEGLFQMDVDSNLWNSLAAAKDFPDGVVPGWLGDKDVRQGIQFFQEYLSSEREIERCQLEAKNLKQWYWDEYYALKFAISNVEGAKCFK